MYSKKMWEIVKQALNLVKLKEPNCLFVGSECDEQFVFFAEVDYESIAPIEKNLKQLNVVWIAKFECLGINTDILWDER